MSIHDDRQNDFVDLANCRGDTQVKEYQKILDSNTDPFGSREEIEKLGNTIVDETEHWWIIKNQWYPAGLRFVVISKTFALFPEDLSPKAQLDAFAVFKKVREEYGITGGGLCMRFGDTRLSGASVKHLHFHIIEPAQHQEIPFWLGHNPPTNNE